ncbi:hypothetical protein ABT075_02845 [Streptomyces sp. NPDC002677]|uniref:hypothetical protein n=1 Tax=Streptomyces sp. NPDC002677 TaxID=3154774 RepID=UPI003328107E
MPVVDADWVGVADRDAVADGLGLAVRADEAVGDALAPAGADAAGTAGADACADVTGAAAEGDPVLGVTSGTLSRTSCGAAVSRVGVTWENSPLAKPATARIPITAPAIERTSTHRDRRRRASP